MNSQMNSQMNSMYWTVVCLNGLLAIVVLTLAWGLWRWRTQLQQLTAKLRHIQLNPQQVGYAITLQRLQLAQARLGVAQWQGRSRQVRQILQLVSLMRTMLLYYSRWRYVNRRGKEEYRG